MLSLTYLQMVNIVLGRINQPEVSTLAGVTGVPLSIKNKFKLLVDQLSTETDWWIHIQIRTFNTIASTDTYALAPDFLKPAILMDTTTRRTLVQIFPRTFEVGSMFLAEGSALNYAIEGSNYVLYPIPGSIVTLKDVYWRAPLEFLVDSDVPDLPREIQYTLVENVLGSQNEDRKEFEMADRNFRKFQRAFDKVLETNQKRVSVIFEEAQEPLAFNGTFPFVQGAGIEIDIDQFLF